MCEAGSVLTSAQAPGRRGATRAPGPAMRRLLTGVALTAVAVGALTWLLEVVLVDVLQYEKILFVLLVVTAAALGGAAAWLAAVLLSGVAVSVFEFQPSPALMLGDPGSTLELVLLVGVTGLVALVSDFAWRARAHSARAEREAVLLQASLQAEQEKLRAADALRLSDQRLRVAFDAFMDPIEILQAVHDDQGRLVDFRFLKVNQAVEDHVGLPAAVLEGAQVHDLFPDLDATFPRLWRQVVETGRPVAADDLALPSVMFDGQVRRFSVRGAPLPDGLVFTFRDVTHAFEAAERLRRSEGLHRLISEYSNDAVFILDDGAIEWASPSSERWLGWTPDELVGRSWAEFLVDEDVDWVRARHFAPGGERMRFRARYRHRDGGVHWAQLAFGPLSEEPTSRTHLVVAGQMIDEQVAAEEEARELAQRLESLVGRLPQGVFRVRVSADHRVALDFASPRTAELLGAAEPDGSPVDAYRANIHPDDFPALIEATRAVAAGHGPLVWEGRSAGQPPLWLRIQGSLEEAPDGDRIFDAIVSDITAERRLQTLQADEARAHAERAEHLAEVDRMKSALLAALGHDLRTPLAVIASSANGLRSGDALDAAERGELLGNIEVSADSLARQLTNLLDMSRVEVGSLVVRLGRVDLFEALEEPLRALDSPVDLDLPDDLPELAADVGLLERVLDNLLRNAMNHSPDGSAVMVSARQAGDRVLCHVADHGPGIDPQAFDRIFEPFLQLDDRSPQGIGLGLPVARAFTEAMGGRLTPSPTPGGGLTMTLDLEVADAAPARR